MIPILAMMISVLPVTAADSALSNGDYDTAVKMYRIVLEREPESYGALFGLARALAFSGELDESIAVYDDLLDIYPDDADGHLGRGRVLAWRGRFEESETDLLFVTMNYPGYGDAWAALGDLYLWWGKADRSVEAYGTLVKLQPDDPGPLIARAKAFRAARKFARARRDLYRSRNMGGDEAEIGRLLTELARVPSATGWEGAWSFDLQTFDGDLDDWKSHTVSIKHGFAGGTLIGGVNHAERFSLRDEAVFVDGYVDLWPGSYCNARVTVGLEAEILPEFDYHVEVYQVIGQGWEGSVDFRQMLYVETGVELYSASMAKYIGPWYLRGRGIFIPGGEGEGVAGIFTARRYLGQVDDFLELWFGRTREVLKQPDQRDLYVRRGLFTSLLGHFYFHRNWGVSAALNYKDEDDYPVQRGVNLAILSRW